MQNIIFLLATTLVVCSIVAAYTHLAGFSKVAQLAGDEAAKERIKKTYPNSALAEFKMASDRRAALAIFEDGTGCLLHALGHKWVLHALTKDSIHRAKVSPRGALRLAFNDYTAPNISISLGDETTHNSWLAALLPFMDAPPIAAEMEA